MAKLIAFAGACHSGKTTMINKLVNEIPGVTTLKEILREKPINIDEVRKDPNAYLDLQIEVISQKIAQEESVMCDSPAKVVLADRSLADSLYYFTFYLDKAHLTPKNRERYFTFLSSLLSTLTLPRYDAVFLCRPILIQPEHLDPHRPLDLVMSQQAEYTLIQSYVSSFIRPLKKTFLMSVHLPNQNDAEMVHRLVLTYL